MTTHAETDEMTDEEFPNVLFRDFAKAMDDMQVQTFDSDFAVAMAAFKKVETEFIFRSDAEEFEILEMKRRVAEAILKAAVEKCVGFETCLSIWTDLLRLGFTNFDRTCTMTWYFAECCLQNGKSEVGFALIEPLIAEAERLLAEPPATEAAAEYYRYEIDNLGRLGDKLKALQK